MVMMEAGKRMRYNLYDSLRILVRPNLRGSDVGPNDQRINMTQLKTPYNVCDGMNLLHPVLKQRRNSNLTGFSSTS